MDILLLSSSRYSEGIHLLFGTELPASRSLDVPNQLVCFVFGVVFWLHHLSFQGYYEPKTSPKQSPLSCPNCAETEQRFLLFSPKTLEFGIRLHNQKGNGCERIS